MTESTEKAEPQGGYEDQRPGDPSEILKLIQDHIGERLYSDEELRSLTSHPEGFIDGKIRKLGFDKDTAELYLATITSEIIRGYFINLVHAADQGEKFDNKTTANQTLHKLLTHLDKNVDANLEQIDGNATCRYIEILSKFDQ